MAMLTPHFSSAELGNPPSRYAANAQATAELLEAIRGVLGVPLRITSGYRSASKNVAVGGAAGSGHLTASAADFVPIGLTVQETAKRLEAARRQGAIAYGEMIYYVVDGHVHVTLPGVGGDGETLVRLASGKTTSDLSVLIGSGSLALLLIVAGAIIVRKG